MFSYNDVLTYLLQQLPMFQRVGAAAYRNNLNNIIHLCNLLGNPQGSLKCIHVAGTNGKGSVTHLIASVLQQQGYKVGVFVSPHYKDYRERIKINGKYISKAFVTKFVQQNKEKFSHLDASFFEITTAMAFEYFKQKKVDYAVIEVGMGGRLDSTNIIHPILSVITNISYDHTQFLGHTLPLIAGEKAGIIKQGVPVVIGETQKETKPVFTERAKAMNASILFADRMKLKLPAKAIPGSSYGKKNLTTALAAISVLQKQGIKISLQSIRLGVQNVVKNTSFIGRWMPMGKQPTVIFDSAHNEGGLRELKKSLRFVKYQKLHFVYGTVGDKDITKNLALLPRQAVYYFCNANLPRALPAEQLQMAASAYHLKGNVYSSVKAAYNAAKKQAGKNDLVLVAGSVFVVAEVL